MLVLVSHSFSLDIFSSYACGCACACACACACVTSENQALGEWPTTGQFMARGCDEHDIVMGQKNI